MTDAQVERLAKHLYERVPGKYAAWETLAHAQRRQWLELARTYLDVAGEA